MYLRLSVCLFSRPISQKPMQLGSPNMTCCTTSPGNTFILGSNVNVTSHKNIACVSICTLVSAGFLLVVELRTDFYHCQVISFVSRCPDTIHMESIESRGFCDQVGDRSRQARPHTHTHTHTHRQREKERQRGTHGRYLHAKCGRQRGN